MDRPFLRLCLLASLAFAIAACDDSSSGTTDAGTDLPAADLDANLDAGDPTTPDADPSDLDPDAEADGAPDADAEADLGPEDGGPDVPASDTAEADGDLDQAPDDAVLDLGDEGAGDPDANADAGTPDVDASIDPDLVIDVPEEPLERVRIVSANITSGNFQRYEAPGIRILQGLAADIVLIQEFRYANEPVFQFGNLAGFVDGTFGEAFYYHVGTGSLPNGIVSRYPIVEAGTWPDETLGNRGFDYARIDIPGPYDLWAVSLHLKAGGGDASQRNQQASAVVDYIEEHVPEADFLVLGGDLNTGSRTEGCIGTLSAVVETDGPWPVDTSGNDNTNAGRDDPYDWVLPDEDLDAYATSVQMGEQVFPSGLVVDTREYVPLSDLAPAQESDSSAFQMQHMAVVRDFDFHGIIPGEE